MRLASAMIGFCTLRVPFCIGRISGMSGSFLLLVCFGVGSSGLSCFGSCKCSSSMKIIQRFGALSRKNVYLQHSLTHTSISQYICLNHYL